MTVSDCFTSVVVPVHNDADIVEDLIRDVMTVLRGTYAHYELVLVDDGSDDATVQRILPLLQQLDCIRLIRLSRKSGEEIAIFAGLEAVIGDFVVVLMPNWDPPELIPQMVERARQGAEVVFGVTKDRHEEGFLVRIGASLFDSYCRRVLKLDLPQNSTQFRAMSRQAVNAITQVKNVHRFLRILTADVGFRRESLLYTPVNRSGRPGGKRLFDAVSMAVDMLITSSQHPLRFATWLGVLASAFNMLYAIYVVAIVLFKDHVAEGWTTLSMQNAVMFFFVFLILTVSSEYIGHILIETIDRPLYYVLEERTSSVLIANESRKNVTDESESQIAKLSAQDRAKSDDRR